MYTPCVSEDRLEDFLKNTSLSFDLKDPAKRGVVESACQLGQYSDKVKGRLMSYAVHSVRKGAGGDEILSKFRYAISPSFRSAKTPAALHNVEWIPDNTGLSGRVPICVFGGEAHHYPHGGSMVMRGHIDFVDDHLIGNDKKGVSLRFATDFIGMLNAYARARIGDEEMPLPSQFPNAPFPCSPLSMQDLIQRNLVREEGILKHPSGDVHVDFILSDEDYALTFTFADSAIPFAESYDQFGMTRNVVQGVNHLELHRTANEIKAATKPKSTFSLQSPTTYVLSRGQVPREREPLGRVGYR